MDSFIQKLTRRQHLAGNSTETNQNDTEQSDNQISTSHLKRTLNLPALIFLNISCSIGSGKTNYNIYNNNKIYKFKDL